MSELSLFDNDKAWKDEWEGMPEFVQEDLEPFQSIYVHFENRKDLDAFSKMVGQKITAKTKGIWFPENKCINRTKKEYINEE